MANLETRKANKGDCDFAWSLYAENVKPLISQYMTRKWEDDKEKKRFEQIWKVEDTHIITLDGADVGWFSCTSGPNAVAVEHGYLAKPHQKRRIGSIILDFIAKEAKRQNKKVELSVLKNNPAQAFFTKQGLNIAAQTNEQIQFET